jgi:hypothetical protein
MESKKLNFFENQNLKEIYLSNENLIKIMFKYCSLHDILNLSLVSKKFNQIAQKFDYLFKELINNVFFSNYENYK